MLLCWVLSCLRLDSSIYASLKQNMLYILIYFFIAHKFFSHHLKKYFLPRKVWLWYQNITLHFKNEKNLQLKNSKD